MHRTAASLAIAVLCVSVGGSSAEAAKSRTPVASTIKDLGMSPQELRIRVRALIRPTLGIVEETADRSVRDAADPSALRSALRWKIEATTTLLSAMLRNDPVLALADAWGYAFQVEDFLATPEVAARYGPLARDGTAGMEQVRALFREFATVLPAALSGEALETKLRPWAERNPIEGHLYRRPSMDSAFAGILASAGGRGAFAAVASLEETTSDVMTRMDLYTMYLPRLARWEAELAVNDLAQGVDANQLAADFEQLSGAVDRLAGVAESLSAIVARERAAAVDAVRAERVAATRDLQGERRAVLDALREERIAALAEVEAIARRLLDRSSGPLQQAVRKDLEDLVSGVEGMRRRLIEEGGVTLEGVVDHAFLRALQLLFIVAALGAVGIVLYVRFLRPR